MLDPSEAPATGTRVRGGLTLRSKCPELTRHLTKMMLLKMLIPEFNSLLIKVWFALIMLMKLQGGSPAGSLGKLHRTSCCCWYGWGSLISILRQQMIHSLCFHILMVDSCLNRWTLAWPNLSETLSGQLKLQAASFLLPLVFASSHLCDLLPVLRTASVEHLQNSLLYSLNMNDS